MIKQCKVGFKISFCMKISFCIYKCSMALHITARWQVNRVGKMSDVYWEIWIFRCQNKPCRKITWEIIEQNTLEWVHNGSCETNVIKVIILYETIKHGPIRFLKTKEYCSVAWYICDFVCSNVPLWKKNATMKICAVPNLVFKLYTWNHCHSATPQIAHQEFVHDDVIKWKHFPRYWSFVRGICRWP